MTFLEIADTCWNVIGVTLASKFVTHHMLHLIPSTINRWQQKPFCYANSLNLFKKNANANF